MHPNSIDTVRVNVRHFRNEMRRGQSVRLIGGGIDWGGVVQRSLVHEAAHLSGLRGHQYFEEVEKDRDGKEEKVEFTAYGRTLVKRLGRERGYAAASKNASNYACFVMGRGQDC